MTPIELVCTAVTPHGHCSVSAWISKDARANLSLYLLAEEGTPQAGDIITLVQGAIPVALPLDPLDTSRAHGSATTAVDPAAPLNVPDPSASVAVAEEVMASVLNADPVKT